MITLKAPIGLKVRTDYMQGYDSFGERIIGNYSLMGLEIGEEELLHMVSEPPEIYLAEAGSTTIGGNTFVSNRNEEKFDIVNNMLNRILVSVNSELTYQDRTYITDALYKLGIKDDRKFMNEVRRMINQSNLEEDFLNNYIEMRISGESRELREKTLELTKELVERNLYEPESEREDFLSERIMHRLQTGAIYQIVSNFNKSLSDTRIEMQESMISEQENVAKKMLVQHFLNSVVRENPELIHREERPESEDIERIIYERETDGRIRGEAETVLREKDSEYRETKEREYRESEQYLTEKERELYTERESAEMILREESRDEYYKEGYPGEASETKKEQDVARGSEAITGQSGERSIPEGQAEEGRTVIREAAPERESEGGPEKTGHEVPSYGEKERYSEERILSSEERSTEYTHDRTERYVTEQQGYPSESTFESSEIVYREEKAASEAGGEDVVSAERLTETERLERERLRESEKIRLERERSLQREELLSEVRTELKDIQDASIREASGTKTPETPIGGDVSVSSEVIYREADRKTTGAEQLPGEIVERTSEERTSSTVERSTEERLEKTERYVTESQEIPERTEYERSEIVYREEGTAPGAEDEYSAAFERLKQTERVERERINERERLRLERERKLQSDKLLSEVRTEVREQQEASEREASRTDASEAKQGRMTPVSSEVIYREGESRTLVTEQIPGETVEKTSEERITSIHERSSEERLESTERYVTESREVPTRTEYERSEIVYREEGAAAEAEGKIEVSPGPERETQRLERDRYHESTQTEKERERSFTKEELISEIRSEVSTAGEPSEQTRSERSGEGRTENRTQFESTERIYRESPEIKGENAEYPEGMTREVREEIIREGERTYSRDLYERERSTSSESRTSELRRELKEQLLSETERALQQGTQVYPEGNKEYSEAEIVYRREKGDSEGEALSEEAIQNVIRETNEKERERITERERSERERSREESRDRTVSEVRTEQIERGFSERKTFETAGEKGEPGSERTYERSEFVRSERTVTPPTSEVRSEHEKTELIYREEAKPFEEEAISKGTGRKTASGREFVRESIYERELFEKNLSKEELTRDITAAVLLDVVKNLFYVGYDRINKGDTWIEYRGALYQASENVFNRINYDTSSRISTSITEQAEYNETNDIEQVSLEELEEITENVAEVETIERTIREMNEMNLQNVERYEKMLGVLQKLSPEKNRTGGKERTRQEALSLLDNEQELYESLRKGSGEAEDDRREVFREITRLFPDSSVEVFRVIDQYLDGNLTPEKIGISRNNVEEAAEEIRRITDSPQVKAEPVVEQTQMQSSEMVFRRSERMSQEELEEVIENIRRTTDRQKNATEQRQEITENVKSNIRTVNTNAERTLSRQETEDIEELVSRGVRAQMGAISEQVLQKLEKKLRNEKARRGI